MKVKMEIVERGKVAEAILIYKDSSGKEYRKSIEVEKGEKTRNETVLFAIVSGLRKLKKPCDVSVRVSNHYVKSCIENGWLESWKENGWQRGNGRELANQRQWKELYLLLCIHRIRFDNE